MQSSTEAYYGGYVIASKILTLSPKSMRILLRSSDNFAENTAISHVWHQAEPASNRVVDPVGQLHLPLFGPTLFAGQLRQVLES